MGFKGSEVQILSPRPNINLNLIDSSIDHLIAAYHFIDAAFFMSVGCIVFPIRYLCLPVLPEFCTSPPENVVDLPLEGIKITFKDLLTA